MALIFDLVFYTELLLKYIPKECVRGSPEGDRKDIRPLRKAGSFVYTSDVKLHLMLLLYFTKDF